MSGSKSSSHRQVWKFFLKCNCGKFFFPRGNRLLRAYGLLERERNASPPQSIIVPTKLCSLSASEPLRKCWNFWPECLGSLISRLLCSPVLGSLHLFGVSLYMKMTNLIGPHCSTSHRPLSDKGKPLLFTLLLPKNPLPFFSFVFHWFFCSDLFWFPSHFFCTYYICIFCDYNYNYIKHRQITTIYLNW